MVARKFIWKEFIFSPYVSPYVSGKNKEGVTQIGDKIFHGPPANTSERGQKGSYNFMVRFVIKFFNSVSTEPRFMIYVGQRKAFECCKLYMYNCTGSQRTAGVNLLHLAKGLTLKRKVDRLTFGATSHAWPPRTGRVRVGHACGGGYGSSVI